MFDLSHPAVKHAQELANRTRKSYLLIPNFIGGYDAVPADRVGLDCEVKSVGFIYPHPIKEASPCLQELMSTKELNGLIQKAATLPC